MRWVQLPKAWRPWTGQFREHCYGAELCPQEILMRMSSPQDLGTWLGLEVRSSQRQLRSNEVIRAIIR